MQNIESTPVKLHILKTGYLFLRTAINHFTLSEAKTQHLLTVKLLDPPNLCSIPISPNQITLCLTLPLISISTLATLKEEHVLLFLLIQLKCINISPSRKIKLVNVSHSMRTYFEDTYKDSLPKTLSSMLPFLVIKSIQT